MAETNAITRTTPATARSITRNGHDSRPSPWSYRPATDIVEHEDAYVLTADVPGATRESINLSVEDGVVSIQAHVPPRHPEDVRFTYQEYGVGDYHRRFRLGDDVDEAGITAAYTNGVLTVRLPKRAEAQARRIPIAAA